jgi:hypothetical protein
MKFDILLSELVSYATNSVWHVLVRSLPTFRTVVRNSEFSFSKARSYCHVHRANVKKTWFYARSSTSGANVLRRVIVPYVAWCVLLYHASEKSIFCCKQRKVQTALAISVWRSWTTIFVFRGSYKWETRVPNRQGPSFLPGHGSLNLYPTVAHSL